MICFSLAYILHFIWTFCLQIDMTKILRNLKRQKYRTGSDWNISFIKQRWRYLHSERLQLVNKIGQQVYLWRREQQRALLPIITTLPCDFEKYLYLIYSYTPMCRWVGIFQKSRDPIVMTLLAPGEECHLDFSPKSCTYPTLVTIEVKIISILLYENNNCPSLFCTFTIGNSSFLTTVEKKKFCVSLFSVQKFLIYIFKLLSLLRRLYCMSSTTYIHYPLPVTPWCHSVTQTWPTKPLQYLGIKL